MGIVTLNDLVKEIVRRDRGGNTACPTRPSELPDHRLRVSGSLHGDDFNETFHTALPTEPARTSADLVAELGRSRGAATS